MRARGQDLPAHSSRPPIPHRRQPLRISTRGWRQDLLLASIPLHLRYERGGRIEFRLRPDPADEENLDRLGVKIARENRTEKPPKAPGHYRTSGGGRNSPRRHRFCPGDNTNRVDAVAQPATRVRQKIGRRKSQCPAEFLAVDDFAHDRKGVTEQSCGIFYVACLECRRAPPSRRQPRYRPPCPPKPAPRSRRQNHAVCPLP